MPLLNCILKGGKKQAGMAELGPATASGGHTPDLRVQGPRGVRVEPAGPSGKPHGPGPAEKGQWGPGVGR